MKLKSEPLTSPSTLLQLVPPAVLVQLSPLDKALRKSEAFKHREKIRCIVHFLGELLYTDIFLSSFLNL